MGKLMIIYSDIKFLNIDKHNDLISVTATFPMYKILKAPVRLHNSVPDDEGVSHYVRVT